MRARRRQHRALVALLVIGMVAGACAPAATPTPVPAQPTKAPTQAPEGRLTFALITKTMNNPFWDMMHEGTRAWCEEQGYDLIYLAPTKPNNLEEQNRLMDDVIAKQVDGIVLCPVDSAGVVPAIERAVAAGIPVSVAATGAFSEEIVTYSGTDNYEGMKMVAEYVAEALDYKGKVIVLDGLLGATVGQDRRRGVDDTLAKYPDIEILGRQDAEMQRAKGMQVMENLLQTHPELDAVLAANDEEALGAIEALDAAGLLDSTIVAGFDGNAEALKAVRDGRMLVTLVQMPEKMAIDGILAILDHKAGTDVPKRLVTEMVLATIDTWQQFADRIGEPAPPAAKLTFALITKTMNNPFWDMMHEGTRAWCEEQGYDLVYLAPTKPNNLEEQNRLMDDVIAKQVDGIVLCPVDSAGVVPAIERAVAAGIPVSVAATGAFSEEIVTYSGTDNYEGMKMVAEYVAEALDYKGKVIVLDGLLGATVGQDRRRGVDDTLAKYPDIEILGRQDAEMQRAKGMQVMENLLQTHPELDAVLAANDEEALGAIEALDAAGLLDSTIVAGFDGNAEALKAVRDGRMLVTLVQMPEKMAIDGILAILDHKAGTDVPKRLVTEMVLATIDTWQQFADRIGEPAPPAAKLTFALITKTMNNPFWDMMHEGTRAWCEEQGYDLVYLAPTKPNNLEEQNRLMDDVIAKQVDGIVLCPVDSAGVVPAIERAVAAGIPVSVAATGAFSEEIVTYSGTDNYEGMKMVAEYVAEALDYKGKVIVLDGLLGATVGQDRRRGVDDTLAKYPDIEILGRQDAEMQRAKGMQVMENLLQTHPELDAVLAANDEEALGAIEALDAAGLLDSTIVAGFDGNAEALKAVRDGRMLVTLVQMPEKMAIDGILAILDHKAGMDVSKRLVTEMVLATIDTWQQFADRIAQ